MTTAKGPLVSVVIPTYNREQVIETTIKDILKQTYENFEIIVVDDGSTDDTQAKLRAFGNRIRVVRQPNGGAASARNRGIQEARGEIIAFQDSDDEWHPSKLVRQVELLEKLGPSVPCCVCNAVFRARNSSESERQTFSIAMLETVYDQGLWLNAAEVLATRPLFFNQVVAVRRTALDAVGGFNPELRYLEDWDLALKLSMLGPWGFIREPLTYWNPGTDGSCTSRAETESIRLHEYASQLLEAAIPAASENGNPAVQSYLKKTLKGHRRALFGIRVMEQGFPGTDLLGRMILLVERYRLAFLRRSSKFPQMVTEEVT